LGIVHPGPIMDWSIFFHNGGETENRIEVPQLAGVLAGLKELC